MLIVTPICKGVIFMSGWVKWLFRVAATAAIAAVLTIGIATFYLQIIIDIM